MHRVSEPGQPFNLAEIRSFVQRRGASRLYDSFIKSFLNSTKLLNAFAMKNAEINFKSIAEF